jgi:hypothetical protein
VKLVGAISSGEGIGSAAADFGISVLSLASPIPGAGQAVKVAIKAKRVHGNSRTSTNIQHRYEIVDNTGDVVKTGISGRPLNLNGTSGRANSQVNTLNKNSNGATYSARVSESNIGGRQAALNAERSATNQLARDGNTLRLQRRPQPQPD